MECFECSTKKTPVKAAFVCGQCEEVAYCGEECAEKHWSIGMHHEECIPVAAVEKIQSKARDRKGLSRTKAREILHHGEVHGHPLTEKQRKYFGYMSNE